jgi:uncharacterized membrane protein
MVDGKKKIMTVTEGITLGIIGTCLTVIGWGFTMWIYTKNQKKDEEEKKQEETRKKIFSD